MIFKLDDGAFITDVLISWLNLDITHYFEIHVSDDMAEWLPVVVSESSDPESLMWRLTRMLQGHKPLDLFA